MNRHSVKSVNSVEGVAMPRAIIYTRVSTDDQGDNFSLPTQLAACRKYAADQGMEIVAECADVMSGSLLDRPGLTKVRQAVSVAVCRSSSASHSLQRATRLGKGVCTVLPARVP